jgi:hypothetical protein
MSNVRAKRLIVAGLFGVFLLAPAHARAAPILLESFGNVANLAASGWTMINNSSPGGSTGWFQGNTGVFEAQGGGDGYIAANYLNAGLGGVVSNWLILPELTLNDGDTLTFLTRSSGVLPDRLEVRFSAGAGADVGATPLLVGSFSTLLMTINPTLTSAGYPSDWTLMTVALSGLGGPTDGRLAFRYFVDDTNVNGDYIGIDDVTLSPNPVPEPATLTLLGLGLAGLGARRYRQNRASA